MYNINQIFSVNSETVVVTGAAGQIGSEIVTACLENGCRVIASDANLSELKERAKQAAWPDENILLIDCDIRVKEQVKKLIIAGCEVFGEITALINNAGVSVFEPFQERTEESIDWVMDVNIKGTFLCMQAFINYRQENKLKGGCIINIASHYGLVSPDPRIYTDCERKNSEIYGATKAGVMQMTRYFAVHAAPYGIRVNGVAPGGVRNPWNPQGEDFQKNYSYRCPMGRMAEVDEIIGAVLFMLSSAASYVNGQTLVVDGGVTAW